jgi:hypothetical protein
VHKLLHIAILSSTILGAAGLALLVLWPMIFEGPLEGITRSILLASVLVAVVLFLLEWRVVH